MNCLGQMKYINICSEKFFPYSQILVDVNRCFYERKHNDLRKNLKFEHLLINESNGFRSVLYRSINRQRFDRELQLTPSSTNS